MSLSTPVRGRIISPSKLWNQTPIGEGSFGKVFKAVWSTRNKNGYEVTKDVAVKVMKRASRSMVLAERNRMLGLDHRNVVRLLGMVQAPQSDVPWLVLEYMEGGDLKKYLLTWELTQDQMMRVAWNVAMGMEYLHSKEITHGDLAARNILLSADMTAKVGDLGYFDSSNTSCYQQYTKFEMPCPIPWMSPENLPWEETDSGTFERCEASRSFKWDVWSYGMVLFEIWSGGTSPFQGYTNTKIAELVLTKSKPTHFTSLDMRIHIKQLMHACWQYKPEHRPYFNGIVRHFEIREDFEDDSDDDYSC